MPVRISVGGVGLNKVPVTQNEKGWYYGLQMNPNILKKPLLKDFDTYKPPIGYKKYTNGSHTAYPKLNRLDFSCVGGAIVVGSEDWKITSIDKWGLTVTFKYGKIITFNHCTSKYAVGARGKAGQEICRINTLAQNIKDSPPKGFPSHLEIYCRNDKIRDLILAPPVVPKVAAVAKTLTEANIIATPSIKLTELPKVALTLPNLTEKYMPEVIETAGTRAVNTLSYAAPIAGVAGAVGIILAYFFPNMPADVAVAFTTIAGFVFNFILDGIRYWVEKKK